MFAKLFLDRFRKIPYVKLVGYELVSFLHKRTNLTVSVGCKASSRHIEIDQFFQENFKTIVFHSV